jgi:hypothetical protein
MANKLSQKQGQAPALLLTDIYAYQQKLERYTDSKCQFSRNMETCVLELLYFTNRTKTTLQRIRTCHEECIDRKDSDIC